jgi:iron complex transport system ATP-binding protein
VLHDLNLAARYADEVALLTQGRLVRVGTPDYALEAQALSNVYGVALDRVPVSQGQWVLLPR